MSSNPLARKIRTRKLGVLISDARMSARKTIDECAQVLGTTRERFQQLEQGSIAPTLPEMELLCIFLGTPLDHFWSNSALTDNRNRQSVPPADQVIPERQTKIASLLVEFRDHAALSPEELSNQAGIDLASIQAMEAGQMPITIPELETIAPLVGVTVDDFLEKEGPLVQMRALEDRMIRLRSLPDDLQEFLSKPINLPYIELAKRLSDLNADRLRDIAEGILEITY